MKRHIIATALLALSLGASAQPDGVRQIRYDLIADRMSASDRASMQIYNMEQSDTSTVFNIDFHPKVGYTYRFERPFLLRTDYGEQHSMRWVEGISMYENIVVKKDTTIRCRLHFPYIKYQTKWFDLITQTDGVGNCFNFYFVHSPNTTVDRETPPKEWQKVSYNKLDDYSATMRKIEKAGKPMRSAKVEITCLNYRQSMLPDDAIDSKIYAKQPSTQHTPIDLATHRATISYEISEPVLMQFNLSEREPRVSCILVPGETSRILIDFHNSGNPARVDFLGPFAATNHLLTEKNLNARAAANDENAADYDEILNEYGEQLGQTVAPLPTSVHREIKPMTTDEMLRLVSSKPDLSKMSEGKRLSYLYALAKDVAQHFNKKEYEKYYDEEFYPLINRHVLYKADWKIFSDREGQAYYSIMLPQRKWAEEGKRTWVVKMWGPNTGEEGLRERTNTAFHIDIWESDGQPKEVMGVNYGIGFVDDYLSLRVEDGLRDEPLDPKLFTANDADGNMFYFLPLDDNTVELQNPDKKQYSGSVSVPETVAHNGRTFTVVALGEHAFARSKDLTAIKLPSTVRTIGQAAFQECSSLQSIDLSHVVDIQGFAFNHCEALAQVTFCNELKQIGGAAFQGCQSLTEIDLPDSVRLNSHLFHGAKSLRRVHLPESALGIPGGLFYGCQSLTEINLPAGLISIDDFAFQDCRSLPNMQLPASILRLGMQAFCGCLAMTEFVVPEGVERIETSLFARCDHLRTLTLPSTLKHIAGELLGMTWSSEDCDPLQLIVLAPVPPTTDSKYQRSFFRLAEHAQLRVPASALEAYKADAEWGKFKHIEAIEQE